MLMLKLFICKESNPYQIMSISQWEEYFNSCSEIDKKEWVSFTGWWDNMRRAGVIEEFNLSQDDMDNIATYMDDGIREQVHFELAPCEPITFLKRYLEIGNDPDFEDILLREFNIDPDNVQELEIA